MGDGYSVGLWKTFRKEWTVVSCRLYFMVGNEQMMKFWKYRWCEDEPLCVSFSFLFALVVFKDAWVKYVWCSNEGEGSWSLHFSGPFNDWEMDKVCKFFSSLNGKSVQQAVEDKVIWRDTKCGKFLLSLSTNH